MMARSYTLEAWLKAMDDRQPAVWLFLLISDYQRAYGPPPDRIICTTDFFASLPAEVRKELKDAYEVTAVWYDKAAALTMPLVILSNYQGNKRLHI